MQKILIFYLLFISYASPSIGSTVPSPDTTLNSKTKIFNVQDFGAIPDDGNDDTAAFNKAAVAAGTGTVYAPKGTFKFSGEFSLGKASFKGEGQGATILDFSSAVGPFPNRAAIYAFGGGYEEMPRLSTDAKSNSRTISLTTEPRLTKGDWVMLFNSSHSSYNSWREYYYQGEFAEVESINGTTVTTSTDLFASYKAGGTSKFYKITNPVSASMEGFKLVGKNGVIGTGIKVSWGLNYKIENVDVSEFSNHCIYLDRCFKSKVSSIEVHMTNPAKSDQYGLIIGNSQNIVCALSTIYSTRHAIAIGGGDFIGAIPNRNIIVSNNILQTKESASNINALDAHGNTEFYIFENNITSGVNAGGNHGVIRANIFRNSGEGIHFSELDGFDFIVDSNEQYSNTIPPKLRAVFIDIGGNSESLSNRTTKGGTLLITNNKVTYTNLSDQARSAIYIRNRGCERTDLNVIVSNNNIISEKIHANDYAIYLAPVSGATINNVTIKNNNFIGWGVYASGKNVIAHNNQVEGGNQHGIALSSWPDKPGDIFVASGNIVNNNALNGLSISGHPNATIKYAKVSNNLAINNSITKLNQSPSTSSFIAQNIAHLSVNNNIFVGNEANKNYPAYYLNITTLNEDNNELTENGSALYKNVGNKKTYNSN